MDVAVLGGGLAGLTAALELSKLGIAPVVYEKEDELGGLAGDAVVDGQRIDKYYHFVCRIDEELVSFLAELGLSHELEWAAAPTGYLYEGRLHGQTTPMDLLRFSPLSMTSRIRFGLSAWRSAVSSESSALDEMTSEDWFRQDVGDEVYERIWKPMLVSKFGDLGGEISAAWMWHRIHRMVGSRSRTGFGSRYGYLKGGCRGLVRQLQNLLLSGEAMINTGAEVREIRKTPAGWEIETDETSEMYDRVISTAPMPVLKKLLGDQADQEFFGAKYVGVNCLAVRLSQPLTPYFWLNINDSRTESSGIIEFSNLNRNVLSSGHSLVYVPYYRPTNNPRYRVDKDELLRETCGLFAFVNPDFEADWVVDAAHSRDPYAQAICPVGFRRLVPPFFSGLKGLWIVDSTQLYPSDRTMSGTIGLARKVADLVADDTGAKAALAAAVSS